MNPRRWLVTVAAGAVLAGSQAATAAVGPESAPARWLPTATTGAPLAQFPNLSAFTDGSAFALVDGVQAQPTEDGATGIGVIRSRDGGRTWDAPLAQPSFDVLPLLAMANGRAGFFASGSLVSRTDDGASSWRRLALPSVVRDGADFATALSAVAEGQVAAVAKDGFEFRDGCPYLLRRTPVQFTADGGRSWVTRALPFTSVATRAELVTAARGLVTTYPYDYEEPVRDGESCSVGGGLLTRVRHSVTSDAGRTWRTVHECTAPCAATWADSSTLVVVRRDGSVLSSRDAGQTLTQVGRLPGASAADGKFVHQVRFLDRRVGYAAVYGAGTFRTVDGGRTWVLERPELEGQGVGTFADVAPIDAVRAVAAGSSGIHARIADPLAVGARATPAAPAYRSSTTVYEDLRFDVDGTVTLAPRRIG